MVVFVTDENTLAGAAHAMGGIVFFEAFEAGQDGGVFF